MRHLVRNTLILLAFLVLAVWAIVPPETKLRKGKDLAGGATLVYGVDVKPTDDPTTINKVINVVKERLDPKGVMDMQIVATGSDRLEITMPLPNDEVKTLRAAYEAELAKVGVGVVSAGEFDRILALPAAARTAEFTRLAGGDAGRMSRFEAAARAYDDYRPAKEAFSKGERDLLALRAQVAAEEAKGIANDPLVESLGNAVKAAEAKRTADAANVAPLEAAFEAARESAVSAGINPADLARALQLSNSRLKIEGKDGVYRELDSPRERAFKAVYEKHPDQKAAIDGVVAKYEAYAAKRRALEDPQDIVRILKGAGVLSFRITVDPGSFPQEGEAREQLRAGGPRNVRVDSARWFKINKIDGWVTKEDQLEELKRSASGFFARLGYVVEEYKGEYYMLCYDTRGMRLTVDDGAWEVQSAMQGVDQLGRPSIDFRMDALGAGRLGALTENNVGKRMGVLLDDEVYTAPTLQSAISKQGQITGNFSTAEREYVIRVLSAGSLKAKLSPEPISINVLGPQLGQDNLDKGLYAGIIAFVVVGGFMVAYYFGNGLIAILALVLNAILLVGAMALNQAAFTLPGIAGIILTFGMAVDANVLIYERMREEYNRGADLRTAVRLGYSKALAAIVDGNITTLIVCVVLGFMGTQEIKGFAISLGIGIATTLFAQLFATRLLYTFLIEHVRIRKMDMLTTAFPGIQRYLVPNVDWMSLRFVTLAVSVFLTGLGVFFILYEGKDMLGTEFRGGTAVTVQFKNDAATGKPLTMKRGEVEDVVRGLAKNADANSALANFQYAEVLAINPDPTDKVTSSTFSIKTLIQDSNLVQSTIASAFKDKVETRQALQFAGSQADTPARAPAFPIVAPALGDSIEQANVRESVGDFYAGVAFVLKDLTPAVSKAELESRLASIRSKPDNADIAGREVRVVVTEGSDAAAKSAVVMVRDAGISYFDDPAAWTTELRNREWAVVTGALTQSQTLASAQSFSSAVATTFRNQAIVSVVLSSILIVIYVWVRFNSFRYSIAAIVTTLHDCLGGGGLHWACDGDVQPHAGDCGGAARAAVQGGSERGGGGADDSGVFAQRHDHRDGPDPREPRETAGRIAQGDQRCDQPDDQPHDHYVGHDADCMPGAVHLRRRGRAGVCVHDVVGIIVGTYSSIAVAAPLVWDHRADPHEPKHTPDVPPAAQPA